MLTIAVVALHFDWSSVGVWITIISIVLTAMVLFSEIRAVIGFFMCILFLTSVIPYLIYFLSCHFRNGIVSWFMVGLCACISLGDPIDAFVDIFHGDPRFLFFSNSSSDVAISESSDKS